MSARRPSGLRGSGSASPAQNLGRKRLNLLSLDGGGVRGLSTLLLLEHLMLSIDRRNPPKPCDVFDMIGGTSTGGLMAIMLGRLRMSIGDCITAYKAMSPDIFVKLHPRIKFPRAKVQGRFDHHALEKSVKSILKSAKMDENALLYESEDPSCKTFVVGTSKQTSTTVVLSSYPNPRRIPGLINEAQIWQAARATSAATSFFEPIEIAHEEFVDGATAGANNPIRQLWSEAEDIFTPTDDPNWRLCDHISCIVSIGTGVPFLKAFGDDLIEIGRQLVRISTDTEQVAEMFARDHRLLLDDQRYVRFNVGRGLENVALEEHDKLREITSATRHYIEQQDTLNRFRACSRRLSDELFSCTQLLNFAVNHRRQAIKNFGTQETLSSDDIAWFTHTSHYRTWCKSPGGAIVYANFYGEKEESARAVVHAVEHVWKREVRSHGSGEVHTLYFRFDRSRSPRLWDFFRSLILQILAVICEEQPTPSNILDGLSAFDRSAMIILDSGSVNDPVALLHRLLTAVRHGISLKSTTRFLVLAMEIDYPIDLGTGVSHFRSFAIELSDALSLFEQQGIPVIISGDGWQHAKHHLHIVEHDTEYRECLSELWFDQMNDRKNQVKLPFPGTTSWIWEHPEYTGWKNQKSGFLWIRGKAGSGKSVLAKAIVSTESEDRDLLVASWFYNGRGGEVGTSHRSMMRAISHQILRSSKLLFDQFAPTYRRKGLCLASFSSLLGMLQSECICLLDGFDEAVDRDSEGKLVLEVLARASELENSQVKFIILSRPFPAITSALGTFDILMETENKDTVVVLVDDGMASLETAINRQEPEKGSFAYRRLARVNAVSPRPIPRDIIATNKCTQEHEMRIIRRYLIDNAEGVILWVVLCLDYAVRRTGRGIWTWAEIREAVTKLPEDLGDSLYRTMISNLAANSDETARLRSRRVLAWVAVAGGFRPLRLRELLDVLALAACDFTKTPDDEFPLKNLRPPYTSWRSFAGSLLDLCGPLIEIVNVAVDKRKGLSHGHIVTGLSVVQLLHQTVKDFLESAEDHPFHFGPGEAWRVIQEDSRWYFRQTVRAAPAKELGVTRNSSHFLNPSAIATYLDDKFLLAYIITNSIFPRDEMKQMEEACSHFQGMVRHFCYSDHPRLPTDTTLPTPGSLSTLTRLACYWGMDTATENILAFVHLHERPEHGIIAVLYGAFLALIDHPEEFYVLRNELSFAGTRSVLFTHDIFHELYYWLDVQSLERTGKSELREHADRTKFVERETGVTATASRTAVSLAACRVIHFGHKFLQPPECQNSLWGGRSLGLYAWYTLQLMQASGGQAE